MSNPYIVVNEYNDLSPTGHTNLSLYNSAGQLIGTYGANLQDMDGNLWNGHEGGVFNETNPSRTPIHTVTFEVTQSQLNSLYTLISGEVADTAAQSQGYFTNYDIIGGNCVDQIDAWLDYIGEPHDMSNMFIGTVLDGYATASEWLENSFNWLIDEFNNYNYQLMDIYDSYLNTFFTYTGSTYLISSDIMEEVVVQHEYATNTAYSPIVIDLNGDGVKTISHVESDVAFDIDGDGDIENIGWLSSADAFLAVDWNGDGQINDGSELFGGANRGEGFAELAQLDTNADGVISSSDDTFGDFLLWQDANSNGISEEGELFTLDQAGVTQISVEYQSAERYDQGNLLGEYSWAEVNGQTVDLVDVYFLTDLELAA